MRRAAITLLLGLPALGQAPPGAVMAGLDYGRFYGDSFAAGTTPLYGHRVEMDDNILKGFWAALQVAPHWCVEGSVRYGSTDVVDPGPGVFASQPKAGGLDYRSVEASVVRVYRRGAFQPYWRVGVGGTDLHLATPGPDWHSGFRPTLGAGVGARFWMCSWFAFRVDVRAHAAYLGVRGAGQDQGTFDVGRWLRTEEALAGVQIVLKGAH